MHGAHALQAAGHTRGRGGGTGCWRKAKNTLKTWPHALMYGCPCMPTPPACNARFTAQLCSQVHACGCLHARIIHRATPPPAHPQPLLPRPLPPRALPLSPHVVRRTCDCEEPATRELLEERLPRRERLQQLCDQQRAVHAAHRQHARRHLATLQRLVVSAGAGGWLGGSGWAGAHGRGRLRAECMRAPCGGQGGVGESGWPALCAPLCLGAWSHPHRPPGDWHCAVHGWRGPR